MPSTTPATGTRQPDAAGGSARPLQLGLFGAIEVPGKSAIISPCGKFRYTLSRSWSGGAGIVNWCMCNPSDADAELDDPTVRKITAFTRQWGYCGHVVTNGHAYRSPNPKTLPLQPDAVGPDNDEHILREARRASIVVVAWGVNGALNGRNRKVLEILSEANRPIFCLRKTKDGHPEHPLYIPYSQRLQPYSLEPGP